jgi:hypothetical protein
VNLNSLNDALHGWHVRTEIYDGAGGVWETEGQLSVLNAEWMLVGDEVIPKTSIARIRRRPSLPIHEPCDAD